MRFVFNVALAQEIGQRTSWVPGIFDICWLVCPPILMFVCPLVLMQLADMLLGLRTGIGMALIKFEPPDILAMRISQNIYER